METNQQVKGVRPDGINIDPDALQKAVDNAASRPITDYEVECNIHHHKYTNKGEKHNIVSDVSRWLWRIEVNGEVVVVKKSHFSQPMLREKLEDKKYQNPDIDILDKFAMVALTGLLASKYANHFSDEEQAARSYDLADYMLKERKKYLTINRTDSE